MFHHVDEVDRIHRDGFGALSLPPCEHISRLTVIVFSKVQRLLFDLAHFICWLTFHRRIVIREWTDHLVAGNSRISSFLGVDVEGLSKPREFSVCRNVERRGLFRQRQAPIDPRSCSRFQDKPSRRDRAIRRTGRPAGDSNIALDPTDDRGIDDDGRLHHGAFLRGFRNNDIKANAREISERHIDIIFAGG